MDELQTVMMEGCLRAEAPLATCPPNQPGTSKVQQIPKTTLITDEGAGEVPFFPGPGIRGKLRRAAFTEVKDLVLDGPELTIDDHYYNVLGGVKGSQKEGAVDLSRVRKIRDRNPLASLFGSGAPWVGGRAMIGHAIPTNLQVAPVRVTGVRTDDLKRDPSQVLTLEPAEADRFLELSRVGWERGQLNSRLAEIEKLLRFKKHQSGPAEGEALSDKELQDLRDEKKARMKELETLKGQGFSDVSVGLPLDGYEAIPAGTELSHTIGVRNATPVEIGLFVAALDRFAMDPFIGGHLAHGCGRVSARYKVRLRRKGRPFEMLDGEVRLENFTLVIPNELDEMLEAWRTAATKMTVDDIRAPAVA